jgi:hypothetical protein
MSELALPVAQFNALFALYNATDGSNWRYNHTSVVEDGSVSVPSQVNTSIWYFPANLSAPCSEHWDGVTCDCPLLFEISRTCTVTKLELQYHRLAGTIPPALADLSDLKQLDMSINHLTG